VAWLTTRVIAEPVDRDEAVDVGVIAEQRFHATEIAEFFLADGADHQEIADGGDGVLVHGLDQRQQRRQSAGIVADPGATMAPSFFLTVTSVPSGNTVSRCADTTSFGRPPPCPCAAQSHCLSASISILSQAPASLHKIFGADLFLERRRGNLRDALLLLKARTSSALMSSEGLGDLWSARIA